MKIYLVVLLMVAGCVTPEERELQQVQYIQALRQRCYAYGFSAGDPALANCTMKLDMLLREAKSASDAQSQALAMQYLYGQQQETNRLNQRGGFTCWRNGDFLTCQ